MVQFQEQWINQGNRVFSRADVFRREKVAEDTTLASQQGTAIDRAVLWDACISGALRSVRTQDAIAQVDKCLTNVCVYAIL